MLDKKTVNNLFYQILRIRMIEERIADDYSKEQMRCPTHLCIGQEAIAAGVCANLGKSDIVFSNHRSHGHYLAKGGNLNAMIAELYGKMTGCSKGTGGSQHLIDRQVNFLGAVPIVAETIPVAVGSALASTITGGVEPITVVFLGDAAMEEGVTHESLNFASLKSLPILFVCENNFYSVNTHIRDRQPKREIFLLARAHGIVSFQDDGNDIIRVYQLAKEATSSIRKGNGPVFVEFITYRYREHCGPNFEPEGFRPKEELEKFMKRDPVGRIKRYVISKNILSKRQIELMKKKIEKEIDCAFEFARESPYPEEEISERDVYA